MDQPPVVALYLRSSYDPRSVTHVGRERWSNHNHYQYLFLRSSVVVVGLSLAIPVTDAPAQNLVPNPGFEGTGEAVLPIGTGVVNAPSSVPDRSRTFAVNGNIDVETAALAEGDLGAGAPAADANDDETVDISDGIYILGFLFSGGPPPPPPGPVTEPCGPDPEGSASDLGCGSYPPCANPDG